jgi:hypothetical protein
MSVIAEIIDTLENKIEKKMVKSCESSFYQLIRIVALT